MYEVRILDSISSFLLQMPILGGNLLRSHIKCSLQLDQLAFILQKILEENVVSQKVLNFFQPCFSEWSNLVYSSILDHKFHDKIVPLRRKIRAI